MRQGALLTMVLVGALCAASIEKPRISRAAMAAMEKSFDGRLQKLGSDDPFMLLGTTRGVYLDGFGAVLTAEVNLVMGPTLNPFKQSITKQEITLLHEKKLKRFESLKQNMRDMLVASAASLDGVPATEQIVVGVSLFHYNWEDTTGMPEQIVMQAERGKLLDVKLKTISLDSIVRTQEVK